MEPDLVHQIEALIKRGKFINLRNLTLLEPSVFTPHIRLPPFPNLRTLSIFAHESYLDRTGGLEIKQLLEENSSLMLALEVITYHISLDSIVRPFFSGRECKTCLHLSGEVVIDGEECATLGSR